MSNAVLAFIKRLTTDADFKTLVQHNPDTAFSQFSLSSIEKEALSDYVENPEKFRKETRSQSSGYGLWF